MKTTLLAEYLTTKRQNVGLSQRQVAAKLGYRTPQFISNWERGVSHPPISAIKKIAAIYGISPEEIFDTIVNAAVAEVTRDLRRKFAASKTR